MEWSQIGIFAFGVTAVWLVGRKDKYRRWGYVLGLCGQPFWFYTAISNQQWGIVLLCCFYAYSWANGIYNHFDFKRNQ